MLEQVEVISGLMILDEIVKPLFTFVHSFEVKFLTLVFPLPLVSCTPIIFLTSSIVKVRSNIQGATSSFLLYAFKHALLWNFHIFKSASILYQSATRFNAGPQFKPFFRCRRHFWHLLRETSF